MIDDHIINSLNGFLSGDLSKDERQIIAEHLLVCESCRREHDEIKLGISLMSRLERADAPAAVWSGIEGKMDGRSESQMGLMPDASFFSFRKAFAFATALIAVSGLAVVIYIGLFTGKGYVARNGENSNQMIAAAPSNPSDSQTELPVNANTDQSNTNTNLSNTNIALGTAPTAGWRVETLAGMPKIEGGGDAGSQVQIAVGQLLETDGRSKAKITVADIGSVEIAPNSRVKLVGTDKTEHRLSLERGQLHAKIFAPPRLFVVDTPSGKAVDLGCEYTLVVDRVGNSILSVIGGFVALEDAGRESIVPAGMMCLTRKGKGLGTPFPAESDEAFKKALEQFDFSGRGSPALQAVLAKADFYDMFTLWHLLSRASKKDRGLVYDALAKHVPPPSGVTREGIIDLNKKMLADWRTEVENAWFN